MIKTKLAPTSSLSYIYTVNRKNTKMFLSHLPQNPIDSGEMKSVYISVRQIYSELYVPNVIL